MGIVDRSVGHLLHIPIHPNSRKYLRFCYKSQMFQFTSLSFGLATAPPGLYNDFKGSEANGPLQRTQTSPILDDWLIRSQSQEEAQVNTQAVVDLNQSLGWIINQEKSELKPTQVFSFVGYEYHLDSALVIPTTTSSVNKSSQTVTIMCSTAIHSISTSTPGVKEWRAPRTRLLCGGGRENCCPSEAINKDHLQVKVGPI